MGMAGSEMPTDGTRSGSAWVWKGFRVGFERLEIVAIPGERGFGGFYPLLQKSSKKMAC